MTYQDIYITADELIKLEEDLCLRCISKIKQLGIPNLNDLHYDMIDQAILEAVREARESNTPNQ